MTKITALLTAASLLAADPASAALNCSDPAELARLIDRTNPDMSDLAKGMLFEKAWGMFCQPAARPVPQITNCQPTINGGMVCTTRPEY